MAQRIAKSQKPTSGIARFRLNMDIETHTRFKALCALHRTNMSAEINSIIAAALLNDGLLSEALHVRVSPELKAEWQSEACRRRVGMGTMLLEAVAVAERERAARHARVNGSATPRANGHGSSGPTAARGAPVGH